MNTELIEALKLLEKERGIDAEILFEAIEEALVSAYRREFEARSTDNIRAEIDRETGEMRVFLDKTVVETVDDPNAEISLEEAKALSDEFELGDVMEFQLRPQDFGRLAAQTAKNVINQKLSSAERERIQNEFSNRIGELAAGVIQRKDRREVIVDIGRAEAVLPYHEQVRQDGYNFNQRLRFLILKVDEKRGRPVVYVSRSHPNVVRKMFEQEVPEIANGIVEIMSVAREAGSRSKIAVASRDSNVDPVGSCVGQRGLRVQAVMDELMGEKIDIIEWDPDVTVFISNSLNPAKVIRVDLLEDEKIARVVVPDHQLSLAIGREGQNARLSARLTGWKIDIKSESQYRTAVEAEIMSRFNQAVEETASDYIDDEDVPDEVDADYQEDAPEEAAADYQETEPRVTDSEE
ncbi:MAG: transcription termination factor NusA [Eubacteriales bacterium]|nr:transcription termination factor NusA [Eubacteriales bacterium]MDD3866244.1 transcription termination factor NusA [Eubacteriales bacterium]MDD4460740.1 transcription termination factor NusA [Eubacteriales bacterium]